MEKPIGATSRPAVKRPLRAPRHCARCRLKSPRDPHHGSIHVGRFVGAQPTHAGCDLVRLPDPTARAARYQTDGPIGYSSTGMYVVMQRARAARVEPAPPGRPLI